MTADPMAQYRRLALTQGQIARACRPHVHPSLRIRALSFASPNALHRAMPPLTYRSANRIIVMAGYDLGLIETRAKA